MDLYLIVYLLEHPPPLRKVLDVGLKATLGGLLGYATGDQLGTPVLHSLGLVAGSAVFLFGYLAGLSTGVRIARAWMHFVWPEDR